MWNALKKRKKEGRLAFLGCLNSDVDWISMCLG
jgi:hypothetical protein